MHAYARAHDVHFVSCFTLQSAASLNRIEVRELGLATTEDSVRAKFSKFGRIESGTKCLCRPPLASAATTEKKGRKKKAEKFDLDNFNSVLSLFPNNSQQCKFAS